MNRKDFLENCLALGFTFTVNQILPDFRTVDSTFSQDELFLKNLMAVDAHSHPYNIQGRTRYFGAVSTVKKMKQAGLAACVFSAVGDRTTDEGSKDSPFEDTMKQLRKVRRFEEHHKVFIILKKSDLQFSGENLNSFGAIMAVEGGDALEGNIDNLNRFYDYGVRMLTLIHYHDNDIGFNQVSQSDGPLTSFGIKVVERMNELGVIVDVAHAKTETLKTIVEVSKFPVVDSHTSPLPTGLLSYPNRSRSWDEMELVAKTGGITCTWPVGFAYGDYSRTTFFDWAQEIVEIKKRLGIDHVGFCTDGTRGLPQLIDSWRSVESLPNLVEAMKKVGLSNDDIIAYAGGNFLRVAKQSLH